MTLPGPEATHRWQGRTLVDRSGEPVGSIEIVYLDKATERPEWALLEGGAARSARTFVPLVGATEEGDNVRVSFDKTLVEGAPSVPVGRELSEDHEETLYRHYGVPYSRAESPSGLPSGEPVPAGQPEPAARAPLPSSEPDRPVREPTAAAQEPAPAAASPPAAAGTAGAPAQPRVSEPAPLPDGDVAPVTRRIETAGPETPGAGERPAAGRPLRITDPRVAAGAGAALAVAAGIWRREAIARQLSMAISRLGPIPRASRRRRRQRRRVIAVNQAVSSAAAQTATLAWGMARLVAGTALLSVVGAVEGGRRAWASIQSTQAAVRQGARRVRPSPRRTRRSSPSAMVAGGTAAMSRLAAIPRMPRRRRRRRRRARAVNRAVSSATQRTAALARTTSRLLVGTALLPFTSAVQGGRRAWAGVQSTQAAIRQDAARRLRRGRRRRRRGSGALGAILGGAAGYVLGARAGEQGYEQITQTAKRIAERPELRRAAEQGVARLDQLSGQAADKLQQVRQSMGGEPGGAEQRTEAGPSTSPAPRPQGAVGPSEATPPPSTATSPGARRHPPPMPLS